MKRIHESGIKWKMGSHFRRKKRSSMDRKANKMETLMSSKEFDARYFDRTTVGEGLGSSLSSLGSASMASKRAQERDDMVDRRSNHRGDLNNFCMGKRAKSMGRGRWVINERLTIHVKEKLHSVGR